MKKLQNRLDALTKTLNACVDEIAELKKEKISEWPQIGDTCYMMTCKEGIVEFIICSDSDLNLIKLEPGITKTEKECVDYWEQLKLKDKIIKMLDELNDGWVPDYEDEKQKKWFFAGYSHKNEMLFLEFSNTDQYNKYPAKSKEVLQWIARYFGNFKTFQALGLI